MNAPTAGGPDPTPSSCLKYTYASVHPCAAMHFAHLPNDCAVVVQTVQSQIAPRRRRLHRTREVLLLVQRTARRRVRAAPSKTSSSNQLSWRNSIVNRRSGGSKPRKPRSRCTSFSMFGGSWKRIGPRRSPSTAVFWRRKSERRRAFGLEPRVMRDAHARLDRERELLRHLRRPLLQYRLLRQPVKGVVDLDRRKLARVVAQPRVVSDRVGIEDALPLLERVAARAREQPHDTMRCGVLSSSALRARGSAFSASMRSTILPPVSGATSDDVMS